MEIQTKLKVTSEALCTEQYVVILQTEYYPVKYWQVNEVSSNLIVICL